MALYIINFKPGNGKRMPNTDASGDAIILIAEGVYHALGKNTFGSTPVYLLQEDAKIRGIKPADNTLSIDYTKFVELTEAFFPAITW